jgi:hypothetical protein
VPRTDAFDRGDAGAQFGNDGGVAHGIGQTRENGNSFPVCSFCPKRVKRGEIPVPYRSAYAGRAPRGPGETRSDPGVYDTRAT